LVPQVKFDTDAWYEMFKWAVTEAKRLGITIGAHNCEGWSSSGGPWITPEQSMKMFTWGNTNIEGGKTVLMQLERPFGRDNFYKDVAVVAFLNQQDKENIRDLYFRSVNTSVKEYNPKDGSITPIAFTKMLDGRTKVPFTFGARESRIFVFEKGDGKLVKPTTGSKENIVITDFKGTLSFDTRSNKK